MIVCNTKRSKLAVAYCAWEYVCGDACTCLLSCACRLASLRAQYSNESSSETESLHDAVVSAISTFVQIATQASKAKDLPEAMLRRRCMRRELCYTIHVTISVG